MPDLLAHHDVAQAARALLPPGHLADLLAEAPDAYAVGAQGPDFFSYAGLRPGGGVRSHPGRTVHRQHTRAALTTMLATAAAAPPGDRAGLYAYISGYATHVCLDAGAHPWIVYWTGGAPKGIDSPDALRATRRHGVLEASLDVMLAARRRPPGVSCGRSRRLLSLTPRRRRAVARLWAVVLQDVYGIPWTARQTEAALHVMALVYAQLTDRLSPLALALQAGGAALDPDGVWRSQIYPSAPHPAAVRLVAERREWRSPWRPSEARHETFAELCGRAVGESLACLGTIARAASGDLSAHDAAVALGDRSMVSGGPCDDPRTPTVFAPDRDALWRGV